MIVRDADIERVARDLIAKHGPNAVRVATERLNRMIDRNNVHGRDIWACIVHVIHQRQGTSPAGAEGGGESRPFELQDERAGRRGPPR